MTEWVDGTELPEDVPHVRDMTPIAMSPSGPIPFGAKPATATPPPLDPDQVTQDPDDPSKYWVMEQNMQVGYYTITDFNEYLCWIRGDRKTAPWRQVGIRTNEGDAIDLILDPPDISVGT